MAVRSRCTWCLLCLVDNIFLSEPHKAVYVRHICTIDRFTFQLFSKIASSRKFSHCLVHFKSIGVGFSRIDQYLRVPHRPQSLRVRTSNLQFLLASLAVFYSGISSSGNILQTYLPAHPVAFYLDMSPVHRYLQPKSVFSSEELDMDQ